MKLGKMNRSSMMALGLMVLSLVAVLFATVVTGAPGDTRQAASRVERRLGNKMAQLDTLISIALNSNPDEWMDLGNVPPDMVVYRYVDNQLQSWCHSFTIANEDIATRMVFPRLTAQNDSPISPLADISEDVSYVNLGKQWFLAKSATNGLVRVIAGLEILNENDLRSTNSVNPRLDLSAKFSIQPLSFSGGSPVHVDGKPQFKIIQDNLKRSMTANAYFVWLALMFFVVAVLVYLRGHRTMKAFYASIALLLSVLALMYFWGRANQDSASIFSPTVFADGRWLYSLTAVVILNLAILLVVRCFFIIKGVIYADILKSRHSKLNLTLATLAVLAGIAGVCWFTHFTFSSIIRNSNITLELYKLHELSIYSLLVYVSLFGMLLSIPMLLQMLRPAIKAVTGLHFNAYSPLNRCWIALSMALYFSITAAVLGIRKEDEHADLWANRLSMDRDIELELRLKLAENAVANDAIIATLSVLPNAANIVQNRIVDNYMYSVAQDNDISVMLFSPNERDPNRLNFFNERVRNGKKISDHSRWLYSTSVSGHARYSGLFTFYSPADGANYMLISVEPKANHEYNGFSEILGFSPHNKVALPSNYSYAKYSEGKLTTFKGIYPYPTVVTDDLKRQIEGASTSHFTKGDYVHFPRVIDKDEYVLITRKHAMRSNYIVSVTFLALLSYLLQSSIAIRRRRKPAFENAYFKRRITSVLMVSLISTLIIITIVSVLFVYQRNRTNRTEMMSEKINSLQTMMTNICRYASTYREINAQELTAELDIAANMAKADITLYTPSGKAFRSTAPDAFDRMLISDRVDANAYDEIVYNRRRFVINKERLGGRPFTALYAPIFNEDGHMVAILSSPYSDDNYDFQNEAVMHSVSILVVFLILLLLSRLMVSSIVDRLFEPLVTLGSKMNRTNIDNLEKIEYNREDEVSTLVRAYNMMVEDLAASSQQLAQAERDKAWSSMARQVAHEIKNPLTPMKLQIQRLVRLKQRNAPGWEDKFDEVAKVVLDHIEVLTDTANEFSTFAKLYTEDPTEINLDKLLQEEISMFDNKENITFTYVGIDDATIMGPKPQLTRVFVNLLTNSVQAIDIQQQELAESGAKPVQGNVIISLRNSMKEGYYDIVFEDNGPGVKSENQERLFTPNFTTKSSGTGLGLAMCRSILEKCNADISYSKSFSLSGACFTIHYPKK